LQCHFCFVYTSGRVFYGTCTMKKDGSGAGDSATIISAPVRLLAAGMGDRPFHLV
jgi:hypothetical protein